VADLLSGLPTDAEDEAGRAHASSSATTTPLPAQRQALVLYMYQLFLDECAAHISALTGDRADGGSAVARSAGAASSSRPRGAVARWAQPRHLRAALGSGKQPLVNDSDTAPGVSTCENVRSRGGDNGGQGSGGGSGGGWGGARGPGAGGENGADFEALQCWRYCLSRLSVALSLARLLSRYLSRARAFSLRESVCACLCPQGLSYLSPKACPT